MHLNQINSFLTVSKTLNFTNAARQLGVPQSTISRQISDLETQLGVRLFFRTKRDVQLTDEGRIFLPYAQEIADAARKGSYAVRQIHEGASGSLSIAVAGSCRQFLGGVLAAFHETYPEISVDICPLSCGASLMDDTESPHDFWFLYRDMLLDPESFDYLHTHLEPLRIVLSTHAKAGDPASQRYILLSEEEDPILYMQAMNYCRTHRFTPKVAASFGDADSVLLAVSAGLGVSFLPESLTAARSGDIETVSMDDESYAIDCIAAWKPSLLNPAAALFLEILKEKTRD